MCQELFKGNEMNYKNIKLKWEKKEKKYKHL